MQTSFALFMVQKGDYNWQNLRRFAMIKMLKTTRSRWEPFMTSKLWDNLSHQVKKCFYSILTCTSPQVNYILDGLVHLLFTVFLHEVIKLENLKNGAIFKVNCQRCKAISRVPTTWRKQRNIFRWAYRSGLRLFPIFSVI